MSYIKLKFKPNVSYVFLSVSGTLLSEATLNLGVHKCSRAQVVVRVQLLMKVKKRRSLENFTSSCL